MVEQTLPRLGIIGAGRAGSSLALALAARGYAIAAVWSRAAARAELLAAALRAASVQTPAAVVRSAELVLLAVPDDAIGPLAAAIAGEQGWSAGKAVVHLSGIHGAALLDPAARQGALTGALHPLQTFADLSAPIPPGTTFAIEAREPLRSTLRALVEALDGRPLDLAAEQRPLYHAAAVMASNYAVALLAQAVALLAQCGIPSSQGLQALLPLLRGAAESMERQGLPAALTGPLARGDLGTVRIHLAALDAQAPTIASLYRSLGAATLPLVAARGLDRQLVDQLQQELERPPANEATGA